MKYILLFFAVCTIAACSKQSSTTKVSTTAASDATAVSTIEFSGYTWNVRNSKNKLQGPGANRWAPNNVWVDASGNLHLKITKDSATGRWYCAEVSSKKLFLYGKYQFWVEGAIDKFDKNIVLGLFNYSGADGFDEMDIEIARWGNSAWPNLNYTLYPAQGASGVYSYTQQFTLNGTYTTHRFTRSQTAVQFQSLHGFTNNNTNQFALQTCTKPPYAISELAMPVYINLWLFQGHPPTDGKEVEVVIHKFSFKQ